MPLINEPEEHDMQLDNQHEPVRLNGWTALIVGLVLVGGILWSTGADTRQIVASLAVMALTSIGGLEFARNHTTPWQPPAERAPDFHAYPDG